MKLEDVKNDEGRFFVETWLKALHGLLGWTDQQTLNWAEKWKNDLNDPNCLFFHEPPLEYILNLLIPENLKKKYFGKMPVFKRVLSWIIGGTKGFDNYQNPNFDWKSAKPRVEAFFKEAERQNGPLDAFLHGYEKQIIGTK